MRLIFLILALFCASGESLAERIITINRTTQTFVFSEDGQVVRLGPVSTGAQGMETPLGSFRILSREEYHKSGKYRVQGGKYPAPMLFAMRFKGGYFIHLGDATGKPDSHGCVRLGPEDVLFVFKRMRVGDKVSVVQ